MYEMRGGRVTMSAAVDAVVWCAILVVSVLGLTSQYVFPWIVCVLSRRPGSSHGAGFFLIPDELERAWLASTDELARAGSASFRLQVIEVRAQVLDEIIERTGGTVPGYVWDAADSEEVRRARPAP